MFDRRPRPALLALLCSALYLWGAPGGVVAARVADPVDPGAVLEGLRESHLDSGAAVRVARLTVNMGLGKLQIAEGVLIPAVSTSSALGGPAREMVFSGKARFRLEPPDEIEAGQIDLFTGARRMDEVITEAVLVIGNDGAARALLDRPRVESLDPETETLAREVFERWRSRPERRILGVERSMLLDAVGEGGFEGFFAGWFRGETLGEFLYLIDPDDPEQVTLGQFVPVEAEGRERRRLERELHRQQRRGKLIGMSVEDLGDWDTWLSAPFGGRPSGEGGTAPFEPRHYELDLTLSGRGLELSGRVRVTLEAVAEGRRSVTFDQMPDLRVDAAGDGAGRELFLLAYAGTATVLLPEPVARGETVVVELQVSGRPMLRIDQRSFILRDTVSWYPHTGTVDRATYDVTLHWPKRLDLVAAGRRADGGEDDGGRWERRLVDRPTFGFSFEIGRFEERTARAGDVEVTFYVDRFSESIVSPFEDELLETICRSLEYYGEIFGPYPLDRLTVVTAPRAFSQSLFGYVTLSSLMVGDLGWLSSLFESRSTVVAHEIAHQWWGHLVGWTGYRDQWISEAMASYSALLFARNRMASRPWRGPTEGWRRDLLATTEEGRTIESIGPVVLGERLASSKSGNAYWAIVYKKGAVVLDMISRLFGEEGFLRILRSVVTAAELRTISTEEFLELIEHVSGTDLEPFARQFVYGTGLPEVYYHYQVEKGPGGTWMVTGTARQQSSYRYRYRVVERPGGRLDVAADPVAELSVEESRLVVPIRVEIPDSGALGVGTTTLQAHTLLAGSVTDFQFELPVRPEHVSLDPDHEVLGRFFDERRYPKRTALSRGLGLLAGGDPEGARKALRDALAAEVFGGDEAQGRGEERDDEEEGRRLDVRILARLARLSLVEGRVEEAAELAGRAREMLRHKDPAWLEEDVRVVEARVALTRGDAQGAFDLLHAKVLRDRVEEAEGLAVLAIAARQVGDRDELEEASEAAIAAGVDLGPLEEE